MCWGAGRKLNWVPGLRWAEHDYIYFISFGVVDGAGRRSVLAFRRRG
jgi:hypothetical protein